MFIKRKMTAAIITIAMFASMLLIPDIGVAKAAGAIQLSGVAHVQTYGNKAATVTDQAGVQTLTLGTRGQAKRVESVTINMEK